MNRKRPSAKQTSDFDKPIASRTAVRRVHYVSSTHWDREWHHTFQGFRRLLVRLFDRVLDDLEQGVLRGPFTTDGQAILLEDYLEIRPENRSRVEKLVRSGALVVGPWYVLPDEWLVSGESLIRNLQLGRRVAGDYGGVPSDAGFVCDLFGHVSQLPQILAGFGIRGGFIWRGVEPRKSAHVTWEGADGTELLCYRFGRSGYTDYTWDVRRSTEHRVAFDPEQVLLDLNAFLAKEADRSGKAPLLLFDGGDHLEYDLDHYKLLFAQKPGPDFPYEIIHSSLDEYLSELFAGKTMFPGRVTGELRETGRVPLAEDQQWLIPGVLSSRVWIKQHNAECQTLLCQWAEPFSAFACLTAGAREASGYLDVAWRWLLQNHPHDSICGCSIDQVHEDMKYRFAQCRQIADDQTEDALRILACAVSGEIGDKEIRVLVANPLAREINEPVDVTLAIPVDWGTYQEFFGFEPKPSFRIFDAKENELPYQLLGQVMNRSQLRMSAIKYPEIWKAHEISVVLRVAIPAMGYTTITVREGERIEKSGPIVAAVVPVRHPSQPGIAIDERTMDNGLLAVTVEANGSLSLIDHRNGEKYSRLMIFEDVADIGDGWYHGPPVNDMAFTSTSAAADVAVVQNGPLLAQMRIRTVLQLPAEFDFSKMRRTESFEPLVIDSLITLRTGCDRVEIETTVHNRIKDHRLRVFFATGAKGVKTSLSDSAFDVVERKIGLPENNHIGRELAVETMPQQSWTCVTNTKHGLAVVSSGLHESAAQDRPDRPVALTLFRSTRRTVMTDGEPEGQIQGVLKFHYWILPQAGAPDRRALFDAGQLLAASIRSIQLTAHDLVVSEGGKRRADPEVSFLSADGQAVVTSARLAGGQVEIRLFNPTMRQIGTRLSGRILQTQTKVTRVNLDGHPLGEIRNAKGKFSFILKPKEIVTLRLQ